MLVYMNKHNVKTYQTVYLIQTVFNCYLGGYGHVLCWTYKDPVTGSQVFVQSCLRSICSFKEIKAIYL